jgi:hypothetical protein
MLRNQEHRLKEVFNAVRELSPPQRTFRLAFTPFAIAGDTVMVCGVGAVVGFLLWGQSGAPH